MIKVVSVQQMRDIEAATNEAGTSYEQMMLNAGRGLADVIKGLLGAQAEGRRVVVLVGNGNNGGDGLVAARLLKEETEAEIGCYLLEQRPEDDALFTAARDAGVFTATPEFDMGWRVLRFLTANADIVVDAVTGIGAQPPLRDAARKMLNIAQAQIEAEPEGEPQPLWPADPLRQAPRKRAFVVAVDCPSGIDCDTGEADALTLAADITVTFGAVKRGMLMGQAVNKIGRLAVAGIGAPDNLKALKDIQADMLTGEGVRRLLPARPKDGHKGSFGRVLIVAGSLSYLGAGLFAAEAAYRSGAGLVTLAVPRAVHAPLASRFLEATWLPLPDTEGALNEEATAALGAAVERAAAVLIGPGLGLAERTSAFLQALLRQGTLPAERLILDADALNLLAKIPEWWKLLPAGTILTPHSGEAARLAPDAGEEGQQDRLTFAQAHAERWQAHLVLKGPYTIAANPAGQMRVSPFATDALATAGTGDILAGCILALLGQGAAPFDAAAAGVYVHGLAGQMAGQAMPPRTVLAGDVLAHLPAAFSQLSG